MRDVQRGEVQQLIEEGAQVVETLPAEEFKEDHLPGAIHGPLKSIHEVAKNLDKGVPVVVYCWDSA